MKALSETLEAALQAASIDPLVKVELTFSASSYAYDRTRALDITIKENGVLQSAELELQNADKELTPIDLKGFKAVLSVGAVTGSGDEYCAFPPMWVTAQRFDSAPGVLNCKLTLAGICNLMEEDKASEAYQPDDEDTKTCKTLINEIAGATLACFNHCTAYDVVWDSEDSLIDSYQPKDDFRIYHGGDRLSAINRLLRYTNCVMRAQADGKLHIFVPTTTGTTYDYEYSLETGHAFFGKALRNRLVMPNYVKVHSREEDDPYYSGTAQDSGSYNRLPKHEFHQKRLDSNDQAKDIAEAILAKAQMWSEAGSAQVPMNPGAEAYDYVKVTDARQEDYRVGNIGTITHKYTANKNVWTTTFTFGNWQTVRKALADLGITSDDLERYFSRLHAKHAYIENLMIDKISAVWIDPEGNIDLSKIGDDLDNLPDGEVYARVKTMHLDAGQLVLDEHTLYKAGYDPTDKFDLGDHDLDNIPEGTTFKRVKSAALSADGLVILDQVVAGTYGLVLATSITAGKIRLDQVQEYTNYQTVTGSQKTSWNDKPENMDQIGEGTTYQRVKSTEIDAGRIRLTSANYYSGKYDGKWYQDIGTDQGVTIEAGVGINIWGRSNALTTRATETGTVQCSVDASGRITAAAGDVRLDSLGITLFGESLRFYRASTYAGYIRASASTGYGLTLWSQGHCSISVTSGGFIINTPSGEGIDASGAEHMDLPRRSTAPGTAEGRLSHKDGTAYVKVYVDGAWRNIYFSGTGW